MAISSEQFEEIYFKYRQYVSSVCRAKLKSHPGLDPEDTVQKVFFKIFLRFGSFREESSLKTWINSVTVNAIVDAIRRERKRKTTLPLDEVYASVWEESDDARFRPSVLPDSELKFSRDEEEVMARKTVRFLEKKLKSGDFQLLHLKYMRVRV